jgi:hypothetical protein
MKPLGRPMLIALVSCLVGCGRTPLEDAVSIGGDAGRLAGDAQILAPDSSIRYVSQDAQDGERARARVDAVGPETSARDSRTMDLAPDAAGKDALSDSAVDHASAEGPDANLSPLAGLRIALLGNGPLLLNALIATWMAQSTGLTTPRIQTDGSALTAAILADYDLLITERPVRAYSPTEAAVLASWVSEGGAVMSLTGYYTPSPDPANTSSLLSGIGLEYGAFLLAGSDNPYPVTDLANHPIMTGISSLPFWGGYIVQASATADGLGTDTALAQVDLPPDSSIVCIAQERGSGRVVVWGDDWIEYDAEFAKPDVSRFWQQALTWLARR